MLSAIPGGDPARAMLLALLAIGVGALATGFTAQYLFGLEPCLLCLWQRVPYALVAACAGIGLAARGHVGRTLPIALAAGIFALGAALAFYHVGVQQHWWGSIAGCGGAPAAGLTLDDLRAEALARPVNRCDEVDWQMLGLSLAGWNALASTLLAAGCVAGFSRIAWKASA